MPAKLPKDIQYLLKKLYKDTEIPTVQKGRGAKGLRLGYPALFVYDPKLKAVLPYYDVLPLSIVLGYYPDGFLGINLHYIPWAKRISLGKALIKATKGKNRISYTMLRKAWQDAKLPVGLALLCIRRYLYSHIRSEIKLFDYETYRKAVVETRGDFKKKSEKIVMRLMMKKWQEHVKSNKLKPKWAKKRKKK
jgi:hypothetical protein